ncbi:MAG: type II toxin-antitoxin system VapC family toxin [Chloroflexi bacterium]|nr:type II toxin-antitoxin system VapC family toxin [Chloroflexota bacterium]
MQTEASRLEPERFVLDSYAVIAFLEGAGGWEWVNDLLRRAFIGRSALYMSVVNLGEVLYITERERGLPKAQEVLARLDELPVRVIEAGRAHALSAAHLKAQRPIAYADCFAAALAILEDATIVTGDPEFRHFEGMIPIKWI